MLPSLVAGVHQLMDFGEAGDGQLGEVLYVGPQDGVLPDPQAAPGRGVRVGVGVRVGGVEQVAHTLTVDLHVGHLQRGRSLGRPARQGTTCANNLNL